jgi:hypothetical protein
MRRTFSAHVVFFLESRGFAPGWYAKPLQGMSLDRGYDLLTPEIIKNLRQSATHNDY